MWLRWCVTQAGRGLGVAVREVAEKHLMQVPVCSPDWHMVSFPEWHRAALTFYCKQGGVCVFMRLGNLSILSEGRTGLIQALKRPWPELSAFADSASLSTV